MQSLSTTIVVHNKENEEKSAPHVSKRYWQLMSSDMFTMQFITQFRLNIYKCSMSSRTNRASLNSVLQLQAQCLQVPCYQGTKKWEKQIKPQAFDHRCMHNY